MKKLLFFLLFFFIFIIKVTASNEIYYSPYSIMSSWNDEAMESSDLVLVNMKPWYKWYKETTTLGDYYIEGLNDQDYPLINKEDSKTTEFSSWSLEKPGSKPNRIINSRFIYEYQDMKEVRYIHLSNVQGSYGALRISEIEVSVNGNKINYDLFCEGCNSNFSSYIKNGVIVENMSNINNGGYLRLDLNNYYPLDTITIKLYLFDVGPDAKRYSIKITREAAKDSVAYSEVYVISCFSYNHLSEIVPFIYDVHKMNIVSPEWYSKKETLNYMEPTITTQVEEKVQYKYQDLLYRYYRVDKEYFDNYSDVAIGDYNIKDKEQYKDYYQYQKRDRVVLQDNLIITDYTMTLNDFIVESTIDNISIESNMDINKNGLYQVKYILPWQTIEKEVTVDIDDNNFAYLNDQINTLVKQNAELKADLDNKNQELSNILNNHDSSTLEESKEYFDNILNSFHKLLSEYELKERLITDLINKQEKIIQVLNSNQNVLKANYQSSLLKLQSYDLEKVGNNWVLKNIKEHPIIIFLCISIVLVLLYIFYKKRSN